MTLETSGQRQRRVIYSAVAGIVDECEKVSPDIEKESVVKTVAEKTGLSLATSRRYYEDLQTFRTMGIFQSENKPSKKDPKLDEIIKDLMKGVSDDKN